MKASSHDIASHLKAYPAVYYRIVRLGRLYLFWATKERVAPTTPETGTTEPGLDQLYTRPSDRQISDYLAGRFGPPHPEVADLLRQQGHLPADAAAPQLSETASAAHADLRTRLLGALDRMVCPWDKRIVERLLEAATTENGDRA